MDDESVLDEGYDDLPFSISVLSSLTGINKFHLRRMLSGEIMPNDAHVEQIERVLGAETAKQFVTHSAVFPDYITSGRGRVPSGHKLMEYVPVRNLQVGDLLAYRRPRKRPKNDVDGTIGFPAWIRILSVEMIGEEDAIAIVEISGGILIRMQADGMARVARPDPSLGALQLD